MTEELFCAAGGAGVDFMLAIAESVGLTIDDRIVGMKLYTGELPLFLIWIEVWIKGETTPRKFRATQKLVECMKELYQ